MDYAIIPHSRPIPHSDEIAVPIFIKIPDIDDDGFASVKFSTTFDDDEEVIVHDEWDADRASQPDRIEQYDLRFKFAKAICWTAGFQAAGEISSWNGENASFVKETEKVLSLWWQACLLRRCWKQSSDKGRRGEQCPGEALLVKRKNSKWSLPPPGGGSGGGGRHFLTRPGTALPHVGALVKRSSFCCGLACISFKWLEIFSDSEKRSLNVSCFIIVTVWIHPGHCHPEGELRNHQGCV